MFDDKERNTRVLGKPLSISDERVKKSNASQRSIAKSGMFHAKLPIRNISARKVHVEFVVDKMNKILETIPENKDNILKIFLLELQYMMLDHRYRGTDVGIVCAKVHDYFIEQVSAHVRDDLELFIFDIQGELDDMGKERYLKRVCPPSWFLTPS